MGEKEFFIYLKSYFGLIQENVQGYKAHGVRYLRRVTVCIQKLTMQLHTQIILQTSMLHFEK